MKNQLSATVAFLSTACLAMFFSQLPVGAEDSDKKVPGLLKIPPSGYKASPQTAESMQGAEIFKDLNCMACHSIRNAGGGYGPLLDAIGSKRSEAFLIAHLSKAPAEKEQFSKLVGEVQSRSHTHVRISDNSARLIVKYLLTLEEPPGGFIVVPHKTRLPASQSTSNPVFKPAQPTSSSRKGERIFSDKGCIACHSIGQLGGWLGPKLDGVGGRLSKSAITSYVNDAQAYAVATRSDAVEYPSQMPKLELTSNEISNIVDYLMTLPAPSEDTGAKI